MVAKKNNTKHMLRSHSSNKPHIAQVCEVRGKSVLDSACIQGIALAIWDISAMYLASAVRNRSASALYSSSSWNSDAMVVDK